MAFHITIPAFENGKRIPKKFTCDGDNFSPKIIWHDPPKDTACFALIVEDPDAPFKTFTHWMVVNIPPNFKELEEMKPVQSRHLKNKLFQVSNDFGRPGYGGPCPPKGKDHRYFFKMFSLNKHLPEDKLHDSESFYEQIQGKIISESEYIGIYSR